MTVRTEAGLSGRHFGRYVLDDLVAENAGSALWRATDPALQRPVGARLIPLADPRVPELRAAALRAAGVHDRRLVRVLDVVEAEGYLAIITEWVTGSSWSELLSERWSPQESCVVALEVAKALESAHRAGATHGRLRPDSVIITDTREVRLRGLGVEAALWGVEPPGDPRAADLHGIGALLYLGLTRRWPTTSGTTTDGLPPAPVVNGITQLPGTVVPDVPHELDEVVGRSLATAQWPTGSFPYADVTECVHALERALSRVPSEASSTDFAEGTDTAADRLVGRLSTLAVVAFAIAGVALIAWQLIANRAAEPAQQAAAAIPVDALPPVDVPLPEAPFEIVRAKDFDPRGDGTEGTAGRRAAIDRDRTSAWYTDAYSSADLNGKGGVGLVLDLGAVRPVRAIDLKLVGSGTDFEVLTSVKRPKKLADFRKVVDVTAAGDSIKLRTPRARNARFVMVWLTRLPFDGSAYVGGLRDVKVVG